MGGRLHAIDTRNTLQYERANIQEQLRRLADNARTRMTDPSLELMSEVYDLLDIDLVRVTAERFEGTGTIPIPEDGGEVWEKGPQRLYSNLTAVRFRFAVTA